MEGVDLAMVALTFCRAMTSPTRSEDPKPVPLWLQLPTAGWDEGYHAAKCDAAEGRHLLEQQRGNESISES